MPELSRADGVRGHAECHGLEPGREAKAGRQGCEQCLPCPAPHGRHEERAGQTGEEDRCLLTSVPFPVPERPMRRGPSALPRREFRSSPSVPRWC